MDFTVKNLVLTYETLADKAIKLNRSYLSLLKIYEEINLTPEFLSELEKAGSSPFKVISSMQQDQQTLQEKFTDLAQLIADAQLHFTSNPEAEQLTAIAHDCQVMKDFISSIDMADLQQMFVQLSQV